MARVTVRGRYALLPERVFRGLVEIGSSLAFAEDKGQEPYRGLSIALIRAQKGDWTLTPLRKIT